MIRHWLFLIEQPLSDHPFALNHLSFLFLSFALFSSVLLNGPQTQINKHISFSSCPKIQVRDIPFPTSRDDDYSVGERQWDPSLGMVRQSHHNRLENILVESFMEGQVGRRVNPIEKMRLYLYVCEKWVNYLVGKQQEWILWSFCIVFEEIEKSRSNSFRRKEKLYQ